MLDSLIGTPAGLSTAVLAASRREATYLTAAEMALGARLADRASVQTLAEEVERRLLPRGRRGVVHPA